MSQREEQSMKGRGSAWQRQNRLSRKRQAIPGSSQCANTPSAKAVRVV